MDAGPRHHDLLGEFVMILKSKVVVKVGGRGPGLMCCEVKH